MSGLKKAPFKHVSKPWGYEQFWGVSSRYVGKTIVIHPTRRLSLQHHASKEESIIVIDDARYCNEGDGFYVEIQNNNGTLEYYPLTNDAWFHIPPGTIHRFGNASLINSAKIIEVSTPEIEDVVRHEDDYGRV